jgi:uncharacterized protein (TIGR02996 family)
VAKAKTTASKTKKKPTWKPAADLVAELTAAESAITEGDDATALGHLLTAWRAAPATRLAEIVEDVSARVAHSRPPILGKTLTARHEAALAVTAKRDPIDLPRLHDVIPLLRSKPAALQIDALLEWPADPRHTPFFIGMIQKPPYVGSATTRVWRRVFNLLEHACDPRAIAALEALDYDTIFVSRYAQEGRTTRALMVERTGAVLGKLRERWPDGPPPIPPDAEEIVARLHRGAKQQRASADELLTQVLAHPADDGPRQVLGDALLELRDPRGELISLQFQRTRRALTAQEKRREAELITHHGREWLGTLAPAVRDDPPPIFERGFPADLVVDLDTPNNRKLALGHPLWATVHTIDLWDRGDFAQLEEILLHPVMRSLRGIVGASREIFRAIARRTKPLPWSMLGYDGPPQYQDEDRSEEDLGANEEDRELVSQLHRVLPNLTHLELSGYLVTPTHFAWLWSTPLVARLERFDCSTAIDHLPAWIEELERRAAAAPKLRHFHCGHHHRRYGWQVDLSHGEGKAGRWSILRAHVLRRSRSYGVAKIVDLVPVLEALAKDQLTEIHVVCGRRESEADLARLEKAARRQKRLVTFSAP